MSDGKCSIRRQGVDCSPSDKYDCLRISKQLTEEAIQGVAKVV